ncbi:hypothetical protein AB0O39_27505 [Streptomyces anulatus]|uniref:hypothetical protein n=1 Tax=Streptomyces anulatus TaxID=1892 RepID=UPI0034379CA3
MLALARESLPGPGTLPGGIAMDLKWDGYRALAFTSSRPGGVFLMETRGGGLIQDRFPELIEAAAQLPLGLVLDGELLVLNGAGVMDFGALQRRRVHGPPDGVDARAGAPGVLRRLRRTPG